MKTRPMATDRNRRLWMSTCDVSAADLARSGRTHIERTDIEFCALSLERAGWTVVGGEYRWKRTPGEAVHERMELTLYCERQL